jgi:signal transduction histidine kinase
LRGRGLPGNRVAIEVEDTGPGIDAERREAVFERFYGEGFGLGLAIVRQAVRVLGGRVELDSEPGAGTVVRVVLPRAEARVLTRRRLDGGEQRAQAAALPAPEREV